MLLQNDSAQGLLMNLIVGQRELQRNADPISCFMLSDC
jgi:hypothetical protein